MEVEDLFFRYDTDQRGRTWTLEGLSFVVQKGEVLGIVGPNGSGKSSLLKLLAGLLRPSRGDLRLVGRSIGRLDPREIARAVAVVPQEYAQVFPFTVAETVLMGRFPHRRAAWWSMGIGDETEQDIFCAQRAMAETDVVLLADRLVSDLSGGERQRVVIARALAQEPSILLLDEPTAFLDINHQIEICALIGRLKTERQLTVVLVSHDLNMASQVCDRVLMLKEGRLCQIGSPAETIKPDVLRMVYGCDVVVDLHPQTGQPRVTMPSVSPDR
ncbi:ABC transporter ATP-binding protein [Nitrospira sp. NS4]|uniref:ABC transporter ATP-binding protein n=1 Tax=Nitrospira sp. NS4 TaxID=3414498 RepID=UPI003C2E4376